MYQEPNLPQHFEALFKSHFSSVKFFINMLLKSEEDAEDIAQDVFTKLWTKPEIWIDNDNKDNYIYAMAKNATLNFIKHKRLEQNYQEKQIQEHVIKELFTPEDPLNPIYYKEIQLILEMTIERFPARRRKIFEMSRFDQMNHQEIASALNISVRTVEHQIYLALQELKKIIFIFFFLHPL